MVKPNLDVADMQNKTQELLQRPYNHPDGRRLQPDEKSIRTVAVGKLPAAAASNAQ